MMDIKMEISSRAGRFYIKNNSNTLAEMKFKLQDNNVILIIHTEVDESLAGKGVGKKLVSAAVDYARQEHSNVKSICSFASAILIKTKEFADVYTTENNKR